MDSGPIRAPRRFLRERHLHPNAVFSRTLHPDHTSGRRRPAGRRGLRVRQGGGGVARSGGGGLAPFRAKPRLRTLDYAGVPHACRRWGPLSICSATDRCGAISTPGHTPDHTFVSGERRSGHAPRRRPQAISHGQFEHDVARAARSPATIVRAPSKAWPSSAWFAARYPQVRVVFGHEIVARSPEGS